MATTHSWQTRSGSVRRGDADSDHDLLYLGSLVEDAAVTAPQRRVVFDIWHRLHRECGTAAPLPVAGLTERGSFRLSWSREERYVEIEVFADGTLEWFFRDRLSGEHGGTDEDPDATVPDEFYARVKAIR